MDIKIDKEYSFLEKKLIKAISPHWANVIKKVSINPYQLYKCLTIEVFIKDRKGPEVEALRRVMIALEYERHDEKRIYRNSPEFDELCKFKVE